MKYLVIAILVGAIGAGIWWLASPRQSVETATPITSAMHSGADTQAAMPAEQVIVPDLSPAAQIGERAFVAVCSACHGINAAGTEKGPPLIHNLYRPGHHPDASFVSAVRQGVVAHHWEFGNMPPPSETLTNADIAGIATYVREMQRANGVQ